MAFLPASRTKRNLVKIASLGLAGLLAGLLAGCTDSSESTEASVSSPYTHISSDSLNQEAVTDAQPELPKSLDATQIPALRHPPSSRSLQYGSVRTVSMAVAPSRHSGY